MLPPRKRGDREKRGEKGGREKSGSGWKRVGGSPNMLDDWHSVSDAMDRRLDVDAFTHEFRQAEGKERLDPPPLAPEGGFHLGKNSWRHR